LSVFTGAVYFWHTFFIIELAISEFFRYDMENFVRSVFMARYVKDLPLLEDPNSSFAAIYQYLTQDGFIYETY
jgi:hypothetical protein